jgi:hypothetical protein
MNTYQYAFKWAIRFDDMPAAVFKLIEMHLEAKGFWRWCIALRTTGILEFVHCAEF